MSLTETEIGATLHVDGTLELDRKPSLPPGRVTIVVRPAPEMEPHSQENWFQAMVSARQKMVAAGCHFMDEKEMQSHLDWLREADRFDELLQAVNSAPEQA